MGFLLLAVHRAVVQAENSKFMRWVLAHGTRRVALTAMAVILVGTFLLYAIGGSELALIGVATAYISTSMAPLAWDLYEQDKASRKRCPDCCEDVKAGARVCRYCGHRWTES